MRSVFFRRLLIALAVSFVVAAVIMVAGYTFWSNDIYSKIEISEMMPRAELARQLLDEYQSGNMTKDAFERAIVQLVKASSSATLIIGNNGSELYFNDGALVFTHEEIREGIADEVEAVLSGETVSPGKVTISKGNSVLLVGIPVLDENGEVAAGLFLINSGEAISGLTRRMSSSLLWIMLIVIPVVMLVTSVRIRSMMGPLHNMSEVAIKMSHGDFNVRAKEDENGEVGVLARALNQLCENLSETIFELRAEKGQLDQILQGLSDGVVALDGVGMLTHYNTAVMQMFGAVNANKREDLISDPNIWLAFEDVFESGEAQTITYPMAGERTIWITISPVTAEGGERTGVVGLFKDMSEMERLEATRREYVSNVSHELRTPLTAVRGLLEPLSDGMVTDEADRQRYYQVMLHEVERLSRLITDMLTISRLQAGSEYMEPMRVDIREVLNDVAASYSSAAAQRGIELVLDVPEELPDVMTDPDRIEQVLIILVDNAMRYTPQDGNITLRVRDDKQRLVVSVIDTGCGMEEKELPHIFERFYKVDKSRGEGGTGLGLYIAQTVMHRLGEEITVESEIGKGTCFSITIVKYVRNAIALGPAVIDEFHHTVITQSESGTKQGADGADIVDAQYEVIAPVNGEKERAKEENGKKA